MDVTKMAGRTSLPYAALLLAVVGVCYWRILAYPHIQDDWRTIAFFNSHPPATEIFREFFNPTGRLFFRPLSRIYHFISFEVFGLHASGFHMLALIWLWAGAWLVSRVLHILTGDLLVARACGVLYAAATSIHMDPMLWEAGINELAGAFFVLLSMLLFLEGKERRSAAAFLAALLFKEACIFLPAVLILFPRNRWRRMLPFAVALLIYAIPKSMNLSAGDLPATHPYALRLSFPAMLAHASSYLKWTADALFPYFVGHPAAIALFCVAIVGALRKNVLLAAWAVLGLAPVLLLPNHCYRYYLTYSLPPLLALFLLGVRAFAGNPRLLVALVAVNVFFSWRYFALREAEGFDQQFIDGTNHLIARGLTVNVVRSSLAALHPSLPRGSLLIFDGVDLYSFDVSNGPRVWYGDDALQAMPLAYVLAKRRGEWIRGPDYGALYLDFPTNDLVRIARGATFAFRLEQGRIKDVTEDFFSSVGL